MCSFNVNSLQIVRRNFLYNLRSFNLLEFLPLMYISIFSLNSAISVIYILIGRGKMAAMIIFKLKLLKASIQSLSSLAAKSTLLRVLGLLKPMLLVPQRSTTTFSRESLILVHSHLRHLLPKFSTSPNHHFAWVWKRLFTIESPKITTFCILR